MSLPFIQPAVNALRNWADLSGGDAASPTQTSARQARKPFDVQYPRLNHPLTLNDSQRQDLMGRLGFSTVGDNELYLALSRTPSDTNPVNVANFVTAVIRHWREENPENSDALAARRLLYGSKALADIDNQLEAAKLAQSQAEAKERAFDKAYHEFRSIPAKHEQLTNKVASLESERQRLVATNWDAKIKELLEHDLNPKPGRIIHESIPSLLIQRDTMKLRLEVIAKLLEECKSVLQELAADNASLAKTLDLPAHNI